MYTSGKFFLNSIRSIFHVIFLIKSPSVKVMLRLLLPKRYCQCFSI
nr:MAG TPA: hypothetical protein [Caudoviricetes sp.]